MASKGLFSWFRKKSAPESNNAEKVELAKDDVLSKENKVDEASQNIDADVKVSEQPLDVATSDLNSDSSADYSAETVSEIGETIGYYMTVCEDLKLIEEYLMDLENITIEDLNNIIKQYLNLNNSVLSILVPEERK